MILINPHCTRWTNHSVRLKKNPLFVCVQCLKFVQWVEKFVCCKEWRHLRQITYKTYRTFEMTCVILEKKSRLNINMRLIFSDISTKFMKSHIDRKFTCFTFVGSGKRKKWMVGKRLKKGEFVSNGLSSNWLHFCRPKPSHMPPWYRLLYIL